MTLNKELYYECNFRIRGYFANPKKPSKYKPEFTFHFW